jgi:hypothetical protein
MQRVLSWNIPFHVIEVRRKYKCIRLNAIRDYIWDVFKNVFWDAIRDFF